MNNTYLLGYVVIGQDGKAEREGSNTRLCWGGGGAISVLAIPIYTGVISCSHCSESGCDNPYFGSILLFRIVLGYIPLCHLSYQFSLDKLLLISDANAIAVILGLVFIEPSFILCYGDDDQKCLLIKQQQKKYFTFVLFYGKCLYFENLNNTITKSVLKSICCNVH